MKHFSFLFYLILQIYSFEFSKDEISALNFKIGNNIKSAEQGFLTNYNNYKRISRNFSKIKVGKRTNVPSYSISSIKTSILVRQGSCDAEIREEVSFLISDGVFSSLTRKISLEGTSDTMYGFKLTSSDLKLKEAKLIKNCYDENSIPKHEYACIIAMFEEVKSINKSKLISIEYEYYAENFVKSSIKPFSENEIENNLVWIFDNAKNTKSIDFVFLQINFEEKIPNTHFHAFPDKIFINGKKIEKSKKDKTVESINWNKREILSDSYENFILHIPIFNDKCQKINHHHYEFTLRKILQFFFVFVVIIIFVFLIAYIYINEKEKHESLKLNEEIQSFKSLNSKLSIKLEFYNELNQEIVNNK